MVEEEMEKNFDGIKIEKSYFAKILASE